MKLLVIAYPLQAVIFRIYKEVEDFNCKPEIEYTAWFDNIFSVISSLKENYDINQVYLYGPGNYSDKIYDILNMKFDANIKIERIAND